MGEKVPMRVSWDAHETLMERPWASMGVKVWQALVADSLFFGGVGVPLPVTALADSASPW